MMMKIIKKKMRKIREKYFIVLYALSVLCFFFSQIQLFV